MMAFANTEDPWIDYLVISRLGGYYAIPIVQLFQDGSRIKIDPQQSLQLNLRLGGYSIWSAILQSHFHINLDFKTDELYHLPASWQFMYY
jgi:hypothetical protein